MKLSETEINGLNRFVENLCFSPDKNLQLTPEYADSCNNIVNTLHKTELTENIVKSIIQDLREFKARGGRGISIVINEIRSVCGSYM